MFAGPAGPARQNTLDALPRGFGSRAEAPNEPAQRAPYEGVVADQREAAEPEEDAGRRLSMVAGVWGSSQ